MRPPRQRHILLSSLALAALGGLGGWWWSGRGHGPLGAGDPPLAQAQVGLVSPTSALHSSPPLPPLSAWSAVLPPTRGVNPVPVGFVEMASFSDVQTLSYPAPTPVAAGQRARVRLGEIPGAHPRHRFMRIEEIADLATNRLTERRVMAADHVVLSLLPGTDERSLHASLPPDCKVIRASLTPGRYLVQIPAQSAADLPDALLRLARLPMTDGVAPDGYVFRTAAPNDPLFPQQYGHGLTTAWDHSTGTTLAPVAVIDSGVMTTHPDLASNIWLNPGESGGGKETNFLDDDGNGLVDDVRGWDFVNDDNLPDDDFGHGTHVAGTIAARGNNGQGIAGVNWTGSLVCLKALRSNGSGLWSDVLDAVTYTKAKNVNIANLSLGAYGAAPAGVEAVFAGAPEVLFCAAAGNGSLAASGQRIGDDLDQTPFVPATLGLGNVISVMAHDAAFVPAPFSNYGKVTVDLAAPGVAILSTTSDGGYGLKSGTSMAAAFVSGCAALCQTRERHTPLRLRQMLQSLDRNDARPSPGQPTDWPATYCASGRVSPYYCALQGKFVTPWRRLASVTDSGNQSLSAMVHITPDTTRHQWTGSTYVADNWATSVADDSPYYIARDLRATAFGTSLLNSATLAARANTVSVTGRSSATSASAATVLALKTDGTVWSIGESASAITGHAQATSFLAIPGLANIIQIASNETGDSHYFLRNDGVLFAMGNNPSTPTPRLGIATAASYTTPVIVPNLTAVRQVYFSGLSTLCRMSNGEVRAWGESVGALNNLLDLPSIEASPTAKARYQVWEGCQDFVLGPSGTTGVRMDGALLHYRGDIGGSGSPAVIVGLPAFRYAPKQRGKFQIGVDRAGRVWEWGSQRSYYPDGNSFYSLLTPVRIPLRLATMDVTVDTNTGSTLALLADGRTEAWGSAGQGLLRNGIPSQLNVPLESVALRGVVGINAAAPDATLAWWADGTIMAFGITSPLDPTRVTGHRLPALTAVKDILFIRNYPTFALVVLTQQNDRLVALRQDGSVWFLDLTTYFSQFNATGSTTIGWVQASGLSSPASQLVINRAPGWPLESSILYEKQLVATLTSSGGVFLMDTSPSILPAWRQVTASWPSGSFPARSLFFHPAKGLMVQGANYALHELGIANPATQPSAVFSNAVSASYASGQSVAVFNPWLLRADNSAYEIFYANPAANLLPVIQAVDLHPSTNPAILRSPSVSVGNIYTKTGTASSWDAFTRVALRQDGRIVVDGTSFRAGALLTVSNFIPTIADATQLWTGWNCAFFRRTDGSIWAWGDNTTGKLGGAAYSLPAETLNYNISTEVQANGLDLNNWLYTHFSNNELGSINISGDEADPDRDGLTNLEEYALGTDPKAPSDTPASPVGLTASFTTVSSEALSTDASTGAGGAASTCHFTVTLKRRARRPGIEYRVEFTDDLATWTSSPTRLIKVLESEKTVIYRDADPLGTAPRRMARLTIRKGN